MTDIPKNLAQIREAIARSCNQMGRSVSDVCLIGVSKNHSVDCIKTAIECVLTDFGENRLQDAERKFEFIPETVVWHFLGRIQSNKVKKIVRSFSVIHSVDSLNILELIHRVAVGEALDRSVFLQVNIAEEASKGGFHPEAVLEQFPSELSSKHLKIVGLMCIPPEAETPEDSREWFLKLRELRDAIEHKFQVKLPYLSMGMSDDYQVAVEEGSTHVRVGTRLFGKRTVTMENPSEE